MYKRQVPDSGDDVGISSGPLHFFFCHPEFVTSDEGRELFLSKTFQDNVIIACIDEAHCIVEWGFDFRKEYANLNSLFAYFPDIFCIAATATAPPKYIKQIEKDLNLTFTVVRGNPDRTNIRYSIVKRDSISPSNPYIDIISRICLPYALELKEKRCLLYTSPSPRD